MVRKGWPAALMVLAMLFGIAHATLHLIDGPDTHFAQEAQTVCPLATVSGWRAAPVVLATPGWTVLPTPTVAPRPVRLARIAPPWRSRAPPHVA